MTLNKMLLYGLKFNWLVILYFSGKTKKYANVKHRHILNSDKIIFMNPNKSLLHF